MRRNVLLDGAFTAWPMVVRGVVPCDAHRSHGVLWESPILAARCASLWLVVTNGLILVPHPTSPYEM